MNTLILDADFEQVPAGGFFRRNWLFLIVACVVVAGGVWAAVKMSSRGDSGPRKGQDFVLPVTVILPKVIPPPEPAKVIEEPEIAEKPDDEPQPDEAGDDVTTNAPEGLSSIQLPPAGGRGRHRPALLYNPTKEWSPYARAAADKIADAMRHHAVLKNATMDVIVRIWIDNTGRIARAEFAPTGHAAVDAALREDLLKNKQLAGPPPAGMRMPVKLKITATRPQ